MLYIFDLDDTLIKGFVGRMAFANIEPLPGRVERLSHIVESGDKLGIVTNQGGVAFGIQTEDEVIAKLIRTLIALGIPTSTPVAVCFHHPDGTLDAYRDPMQVKRRKPSGDMIKEIIAKLADTPQNTLYVGDRPEDEKAALNAGVGFMWTKEFFGDA